MAMSLDDLVREYEELYYQELPVETNIGTYDPVEAYENSGRQSSWCNYTIYESVGMGSRRVEGYDPRRAPGHARRLNVDEIAAKRVRLAELKRLIHEEAITTEGNTDA